MQSEESEMMVEDIYANLAECAVIRNSAINEIEKAGIKNLDLRQEWIDSIYQNKEQLRHLLNTSPTISITSSSTTGSNISLSSGQSLNSGIDGNEISSSNVFENNSKLTSNAQSDSLCPETSNYSSIEDYNVNGSPSLEPPRRNSKSEQKNEHIYSYVNENPYGDEKSYAAILELRTKYQKQTGRIVNSTLHYILYDNTIYVQDYRQKNTGHC